MTGRVVPADSAGVPSEQRTAEACADVVAAWVAGARFGVLVAGGDWRADSLWRRLAEACGSDGVGVPAHVALDRLRPGRDPWTGEPRPGLVEDGRGTLLLPAVGLLDPTRAAVLARADRVLARARSFDDVPTALRPVLTAVLTPGDRGVSRAALRAELAPTPGLPRDPLPARLAARPEPGTWQRQVVALLDRNGLRDHRLDLGAVRLAAAVAEAGRGAPLEVVSTVVCAPRVGQVAATGAEDHAESTSGTENTGGTDGPRDAHGPDRGSGEGRAERPAQQGSAEDAPATDGAADDGEDQPAQPPVPAPSAPPPTRSRQRPGAGRRPPLPGRGGPVVRSLVRGRRRRTVPLRQGMTPDVLATLLVAAPQQRARGRAPGEALRVTATDLRGRSRVRRSGQVVVLVVDASGSMARSNIRRAKGIALHALDGAYRERSSVAVVVARGASAALALPPTRSLTRVQHVLRALPTGGGTPLASAFSLVTRLARDYERDAVDVVVLTDGRANVAENGGGVDRAAVRRDVRARPGSDDARRQAEQSLRRLLGVAHVRVETVGRPQHGAWLREVVTRSASGTR